jgi:outer membrane protein
MFSKKNNLITAILIFLCFPLTGQDIFPLEALINQALEENYQLQIIKNQKQMAENMNTPGNAGMLPSAGVSAERSWDIQSSEANLFTGETRSGDNAQSDRFNAMIEVDWTIFDGFNMFARRDRLEVLAKLGELDTKYYIEETVADLARAYYLLIREQGLLEVYRQSLEVSTFRFELEERKRNIGSGNALLYYQAMVDLNADSLRVVEQEMNIRDQQIQINRIINRSPRLPMNPLNDDIDLQGITAVDELIEMAVNNATDLERARLEEMLSEANLRIERGGRYPSIALFGDYSYSSQRSDLGIIESSKSHGTHFGIRVRFNLYDGGRQNTRIKNALLEQESSGILAEDVRAVIESELTRLTNRYDAYVQQQQLLTGNMDAAGRSLEIAREQFQAGAINGYEFRQTQLSALQVEDQLIHLKYAMRVIEIDIYRISGVLMEKLLAVE